MGPPVPAHLSLITLNWLYSYLLSHLTKTVVLNSYYDFISVIKLFLSEPIFGTIPLQERDGNEEEAVWCLAAIWG